MGKILFSLAVVFSGLLAGYIIGRTDKYKTGTTDSSRLRRRIQKFVILGINPFAFISSIWILDLNKLRLLLIPVTGIIAISAGGTIAYLLARALEMDRKKTGSLFCCGFFTNIGNIGALVCYAFLGEKGYAVVPFYKLFEELLYYSAGFPVAAYFGRDKVENGKNISEKKRKIKIDPMVFTVAAATIAGFTLNLSGLPRPFFFSYINAVIIPVSSFLMLITIGMAMKFVAMKNHIRHALMMIPVKNIAVPLIAFGFASVSGLGRINDGLPIKVIIILSSMPVGILGLIPPALYDLDVDLANTCWFVSTLFMLVTVPLLRFITL